MAGTVAQVVMLLAGLVEADIPVHCLRSDISGKWLLHMGDAVKKDQSSDQVPNFADGGIAHNYCFSGHPNKNDANVKLDIEKMMSRARASRTVQVELTLDVAVNPDLTEHMLARSPDFTSTEDHTWTTAYDEGWEVRLKDGDIPYRFFALAKYRCADPNSPTCGQNGAGESDEGKTKGYMSHCGQVLVGWFMKGDQKGCFWGSKADESEKDKVHSFVMEDSREYDDSSMKVRTAYHHQDFDEFVFPSVLELHKDGSHAKDFSTVRRPGSIKRFNSQSPQAQDHLHVRDECYGNDISDEDKISELEQENSTFDWRQMWGNKWNSEPVDQGACGSCYSIAMSYVLQARANIALFKAAEKAGKPLPKQPLELSAHSVLSCSYYNQGCEGGYPYLVAKHAMEFGIPQESCMPYASAGQGHVDACNAECFKSDDQVVFAKDYNYVGGFYGVCGQNRLMQSIKEWGPVVVAIEVPTPFQGAGGGRIVGESYLTKKGGHNLRSFRFDDGGGLTDLEPHFPEEHHRQDPSPNAKLLEAKWYLAHGCESVVTLEDLAAAMNEALPENTFVRRNGTRFAIDSDNFPADGHPYKEAKRALSSALQVKPECVKLQMADGTINGWEYTNHAIVVVGWGEHKRESAHGTETHKYWIIRNSWGSYYGDNGYAYIARGINYAGIESQAVEIIPDTTRGLLAATLQDMHIQEE